MPSSGDSLLGPPASRRPELLVLETSIRVPCGIVLKGHKMAYLLHITRHWEGCLGADERMMSRTHDQTMLLCPTFAVTFAGLAFGSLEGRAPRAAESCFWEYSEGSTASRK